MDGICRAAAAPVDIRLAGRDYWLHPLTLADWACCEQHLLRDRRTPLELVLPELNKLNLYQFAAEALFKQAYRDTFQRRKIHRATWGEVMAWIGAPEGVAFTTWLTLRSDTGRRLALSKINRVLKKATPAEVSELVRLRARVSGLDLFSRLDRPGLPEDDEGDAKPFPWQRLYREFAGEPYFWGPETVGQLTLYQLTLYRGPEHHLGGTAKMPVAEAREFVKNRQAEREYFEQRLEDLTAQAFGREPEDLLSGKEVGDGG